MKRAFTLVELLGTIILIGLISFAVAVPIIGQINSMSTKISNSTMRLIKENIGLFIDSHNSDFHKEEDNVYYITLEELYKDDMLDDDFFNSSNSLKPTTQIKITVVNGEYKVEIPNDTLDNIGDKYDLIVANNYSNSNGTYFKGDVIDNYVLYNGLLWRIMGKNTDGTIKLVMDEYITSIIYSNELNYENSYVREWLNNYFISMLSNNNIISNEKWYYKVISTNNLELNTDLYVEDKIGLLSSEEYNMSLYENNSYLKKGNSCYGLINQSDNLLYSVCNDVVTSSSSKALLVRPVINVYPSVIVFNGLGTIDSPFILKDYKMNQSGRMLKNMDISIGQYVDINNKVYRIIEHSNEKIKLISSHDTNLVSNYANTSETFNLTNGSGYLLNNSQLSSLFIRNNIFVGSFYLENSNYKDTTFSKKNIVYQTYSALPKIGEILTVPYDNNSSYWTLNMKDSSNAYKVNSNGLDEESISTNLDILYTAYISSSNVVLSGSGTISDPYIIEN